MALVSPLVDFGRPAMGLKNAIAALLCTGLLISGGTALADEYRAGQFLGLDLPQAVLSPKRLGPETQFAPVRVEARSDSRPVKTERVVVAKKPRRSRKSRRSVSRSREQRSRASPPAPSWRAPAATRSTPRRATRASRNGRARPAASAAGSGSLFVGWVERSNTRGAPAQGLMGIASLHPILRPRP